MLLVQYSTQIFLSIARKDLHISARKMSRKFNIEKAIKGLSSSSVRQSRLGSLQVLTNASDQNKREDFKPEENLFKTPMYFIHTQTGSVPHITHEVLQMIYSSVIESPETAGPIPPSQVSLDSTLKFAESLKEFDKDIGKFTGLTNQPVFLTLHDPLYFRRSGHNDKFGVALWSRHGRTSLTPQHITNMLAAYKPSICQIISDYDVKPGVSGMKRLKKSLSRAEEYTSLVLQQKPGNYEKTELFLTVEASWFELDEELAKKTLANLLESQHLIQGVVIAGMTDCLKDANKVSIKLEESSSGIEKQASKSKESERTSIADSVNLELTEKIIGFLPNHLPKYIPGPLRPQHMLELISRGVDIFDSSVASRMADDAEVFILDKIESLLPSITNLKPIPTGPSESLPVVNPSKHETEDAASSYTMPEKTLFSLKDKRFFDDFRPLSSQCTCYTCRKHTRSYVHHLYATDELLGPVLVQIHNLTVLDRFFKIKRQVINESDTLESLLTKFDLMKELITIDVDDSPADTNVKKLKCEI